jgi:hypothetical protein
VANPSAKLYAKWLASQKCPCGAKVTQIITGAAPVPVGLCDRCAADPSVVLDRVAAAQLAGFAGLRRYPPSSDPNWHRAGRRKAAKELWNLLPEMRVPHVVAAMSFALAVSHRVPASWLSPHQWCELLELAKVMYEIVGGKHEPEQGILGDSEQAL